MIIYGSLFHFIQSQSQRIPLFGTQSKTRVLTNSSLVCASLARRSSARAPRSSESVDRIFLPVTLQPCVKGRRQQGALLRVESAAEVLAGIDAPVRAHRHGGVRVEPRWHPAARGGRPAASRQPRPPSHRCARRSSSLLTHTPQTARRCSSRPGGGGSRWHARGAWARSAFASKRKFGRPARRARAREVEPQPEHRSAPADRPAWGPTKSCGQQTLPPRRSSCF